jgi:hypothetical protein
MHDTDKVPATVDVTEKDDDTCTESENANQGTVARGSRVDSWYLWEVGGVILSAACLCTIVGLLAWLNHRELPDWGIKTPKKVVPNTGITIPGKTLNLSLNSVISWISTVGKIAILIPITASFGAQPQLQHR